MAAQGVAVNIEIPTVLTSLEQEAGLQGAFRAVSKGIVVSASAGNSGPGEYTATNIAPWILTVGASTVDREFPADVVLGDGSVYGGVSLYAEEPQIGRASCRERVFRAV